MKMRINKFTKPKLMILALLALSACAVQSAMHEEVARRIAYPAWMVERNIPAGIFALRAYERMHERNAPANIYIEGDGKLTSNFTMFTESTSDSGAISNNPTPENPVALHLASRDKAENVVYLARPCQYSGLIDKSTPCDSVYWMNERFSPEIINSYSAALNEIKKRYDITGFNLIGFSGGGAIAALLAAGRDDILSLRTVAGNLDHATYTAYHGMPQLKSSLNPIEFSEKLAKVPQYHFIGGQDKTMPPSVLDSYIQALGDSNCLQYQLVQEAEHKKGWVNKWPELLGHKVTCKEPVMETTMPMIELPPEPIYVPRDIPAKP